MTIATAQDLDLGTWSSNGNPDIGSFPGSSTSLPHLTVHGTGDGLKDYYSFMIAAASTAEPVNVVLDIDHGFEMKDFYKSDATYWNSRLKLFRVNTDGSHNLVASGGLTSPSMGAGGSSTWFDDYLAIRITEGASMSSRCLLVGGGQTQMAAGHTGLIIYQRVWITI